MRTAFYIAAKCLPVRREAWWQQKAGRHVICLFYHAVSDKPLPHIRPLYRHRTEKEFRADLEWLTTHYTPIRWSEIDRYEQEGKPAFCVTFDDGMKEFYTVAAPILEEMKVPCLCFLNSAFVDNKDLMFRYKEALQQQGIEWQRFLREEQPYLTYAQIRDLQARGFEFGCHSIDHPHFERLTIEEQLTQTLECGRALRQHIPLPHRLFAFPFGQERLDPVTLAVHKGTHEAVFGTANMRPAGKNMYNRIAMDGTSMPVQDIIHGEYLRETAHRILHD